MEYSFILCTHKRPDQARRVLDILKKELSYDVELVVVTHGPESRPLGNDFLYLENNEGRGSGSSLFYASRRISGKWMAWFADDHQYNDPDWFKKAIKHRIDHPDIKIIQFNDGYDRNNNTCAAIGMMETQWYLDTYTTPIYDHYGWDNELTEYGKKLGIYSFADEVNIYDPKDWKHMRTGVQGEMQKRDEKRLFERRERLGFGPVKPQNTFKVPTDPETIRRLATVQQKQKDKRARLEAIKGMLRERRKNNP